MHNGLKRQFCRIKVFSLFSVISSFQQILVKFYEILGAVRFNIFLLTASERRYIKQFSVQNLRVYIIIFCIVNSRIFTIISPDFVGVSTKLCIVQLSRLSCRTPISFVNMYESSRNFPKQNTLQVSQNVKTN